MCGEDLTTIKVPRDVLQNLTSEQALALALKDEEIERLVGGDVINDRVRLTKLSEYEAQLNFRIPQAAKAWKKQIKAEKAQRKAAKKPRVQVA